MRARGGTGGRGALATDNMRRVVLALGKSAQCNAQNLLCLNAARVSCSDQDTQTLPALVAQLKVCLSGQSKCTKEGPRKGLEGPRKSLERV